MDSRRHLTELRIQLSKPSIELIIQHCAPHLKCCPYSLLLIIPLQIRVWVPLRVAPVSEVPDTCADPTHCHSLNYSEARWQLRASPFLRQVCPSGIRLSPTIPTASADARGCYQTCVAQTGTHLRFRHRPRPQPASSLCTSIPTILYDMTFLLAGTESVPDVTLIRVTGYRRSHRGRQRPIIRSTRTLRIRQ